jgi:hypothetical protein
MCMDESVKQRYTSFRIYMPILSKRLYLPEEESSCFWNLVCIYCGMCVFKIFLLINDVFNIYHAVFAFYKQKNVPTQQLLTWNLRLLFHTCFNVLFNDAVSYKDYIAL